MKATDRDVSKQTPPTAAEAGPQGTCPTQARSA